MIRNKNILTTWALILFLLSFISASCNETQIDINSASLEELDKLIGIGPAKAQAIIDSRPFSSLENLLEVKGIGNITLGNIKAQGLACVSESTDAETNQEITNEEQNVEEPEEEQVLEPVEPIKSEPYFPENFTMPKITVNSQTIKTLNNEQENSEVNLAVYGLAGFCLLLATLFAIKKFNRNRKNEFRE